MKSVMLKTCMKCGCVQSMPKITHPDGSISFQYTPCYNCHASAWCDPSVAEVDRWKADNKE